MCAQTTRFEKVVGSNVFGVERNTVTVLPSGGRAMHGIGELSNTAVAAHGEPDEVVTDRAAALANVIEELLPHALYNTQKYANNRVENDHGRLKARLRPMRGLETDRTGP